MMEAGEIAEVFSEMLKQFNTHEFQRKLLLKKMISLLEKENAVLRQQLHAAEQDNHLLREEINRMA